MKKRKTYTKYFVKIVTTILPQTNCRDPDLNQRNDRFCNANH